METIDSETSEIAEIPRLNASDKVSIQLLFLSKFPGITGDEKLSLTAEKLPDVYGFVIDAIFADNIILAPMTAYWDNFKFKTIQYYLKQYTGLIGITSKLL